MASTSTKRRGRKPRGGIANLDDILAYPTNGSQEYSSSTPAPAPLLPTQSVADPGKSLAPICVQAIAEEQPPASNGEVHMHHIDYPWHEDGFGGVITPHEFQIKNMHQDKTRKKQATTAEDVPPEDLDDVDVFPNDDYADYETVFRTQTNAGNKTLHMSARDREAVEVFRPQQVDSGNNDDPGMATTAVPEHMRIISLPQVSFQQHNHEEDAPLSPNAATASTTPPVPEFYHPFRIHFQPPDQHHCLDDAISWPSKSPFVCWWCRHSFEGYPKVSPVSVRGNDIQVVGNFCSWNCSKAWTLQNLKRLDMFNTFYHILFGASSNEVNPAPTYLAIDTFGGPFTIEQFRAGLNNPERQLSFETFSNVQVVVSKMFIKT